MIKTYYRLAKPGIVYGNLLTTVAAFLYASRLHFSPLLLLATIVGVGLVIASACVFNNYLDRDIDAKMARTKERAFAAGAIGALPALSYGAILGLAGFAVLYFFTNALAALIALCGWLLYVLVYTPAKRRTPHATLIGSVPGAIPAAAGFAAAAGALPLPAWIIFFAVLLWQMPHFYGIALYRKEDYAAAGIPTMAARISPAHLKAAIALYIVLFTWIAALLYIGGFAGLTYLVIVLALGLFWLIRALANLGVADALWGRRVFLASLIVILGYAVALSTALLLP